MLDDLAFLERHGKRLVLQLQDVSFDESMFVPDYLRERPDIDDGVARQVETDSENDLNARPHGCVARRWDPAVRERFAALLRTLGRRLDGRVEAVVLPETAVAFGSGARYRSAGFTFEDYAEGVRQQRPAARVACPRSRVMLFAFARDSLRLDYIFWGTEEPYYSRDVLPWLWGRPAALPRP